MNFCNHYTETFRRTAQERGLAIRCNMPDEPHGNVCAICGAAFGVGPVTCEHRPEPKKEMVTA